MLHVIWCGKSKEIIEDPGYDIKTMITIDVDEHGVKVPGTIEDRCK